MSGTILNSLAIIIGSIFATANYFRLLHRIESLEKRMEEIAPWLAP